MDPEKSPIKKVLEQRRSFAGRVEAKGEARAPAAKRPLWVAPTAKTPSEGSSSEEDEFHSAGETSDRNEGDQSSSGEESEDGRAVIRDVVAGVVTRVVASAGGAKIKVIGCGGGGGNAVNRMIESGLQVRQTERTTRRREGARRETRAREDGVRWIVRRAWVDGSR